MSDQFETDSPKSWGKETPNVPPLQKKTDKPGARLPFKNSKGTKITIYNHIKINITEIAINVNLKRNRN